jgi:anti-sigma factor RsiW
MNDDSDRRRRDLSGPDLRPLSAFTDNELSAAERAAMLVRVTTDAGAAGRVADYCAQRSALAALFGDSREDTRCIVVRRRAPRWQHAGLAASCMAIGVALGWSPGWISANFAVDRPVFAERADIAFAVYAPEQRHPVEVAAEQRDQLVNWLSHRLNRRLSVPSLLEYGYSVAACYPANPAQPRNSCIRTRAAPGLPFTSQRFKKTRRRSGCFVKAIASRSTGGVRGWDAR